ncbi:MAG TPA: hypothetical protein PKH97_12690 [Tetrasphaera sp.]|uniref:hypothetical protein n=1 Tax=Nostocoides sp. TaxID=1917966 RepID=UPI002C44CABB|nr:hypothetical protein [Tetrasphaera sp.]HNQ08028.1 hypothetical protein [Tetrasphaera sp.]
MAELEAVWEAGAVHGEPLASEALEAWLTLRLRTRYAAVPSVAGINDAASEWTNLDPALARWATSDPAVILRLATGLTDFFAYFGRAQEGHAWLTAALDGSVEGSDPLGRASALIGLTRGGGLARFATHLRCWTRPSACSNRRIRPRSR